MAKQPNKPDTDFTEDSIPQLASTAFLGAYRRALKTRGHVLIVRKGQLVDSKSDGSFTVVGPSRRPLKYPWARYVLEPKMLTMNEPRLRMFAGPNGSGKSTLKDVLNPEWLGVYINPDDIEKAIRQNGFLDLSGFKIVVDEFQLKHFMHSHSLLQKVNLQNDFERLKLKVNKLYFDDLVINSYQASAISDFIRQSLIAEKILFSFETVMSSQDKVQLLRMAQQAGFRTYLCYIATEDVQINIERVQIRISQGGHGVPVQKIRGRYGRSLALLVQAIDYSNHAFIFDNSGLDKAFIAEVTDGEKIEMKSDEMPGWFKTALWDY